MTKRPDEMSALQAARYVGVSVNAVYHRRDGKHGKLAGRVDDGVWLASVAELDAWRAERKDAAERKLAAIR